MNKKDWRKMMKLGKKFSKDFWSKKKNVDYYKRLCKECGVKPDIK